MKRRVATPQEQEKGHFRFRRSVSEAVRITELAAASRYKLSVPQYRAMLKRERKERIKEAKRRSRESFEME